ncbi:MAG: ATP-grasp domain-containing protein [Christensenella sp.]|nr:ATP-grasp domain-containing protein [Christensenella sp.]
MKLLIIGASILQVPAILKAKEMGIEVAVADYNPSAVGVALADRYFNASTLDKEAVLAVAKEYRPDGIMTMATDMPMRTIAYVCAQMGLRAISEQCAIDCTDKVAMIRCFKQAGVPSPQFWEIKEVSDIHAIKEKLVFPCIMKPADNSGSRGVVLCHDFEELQQRFKYSVASSRSGVVLVEEYMTGDEVSVETFVINGVAHVLQITDKLTTGAPYFVEMGHSQPTRLCHQAQESIKEVTQLAVNSVNICDGPVHLEMIVKDNKARMIELGARMGGDCITSHLVPLSTGIDMTKQTILYALGQQVDLEQKYVQASAIKFIKAPIGRLEAISGVQEAKEDFHVKEIGFFKHIGDTIESVHSSGDRLGYVITQANTIQEALESCQLALEKIKVEVK